MAVAILTSGAVSAHAFDETGNTAGDFDSNGPHGGYYWYTDKCSICHTGAAQVRTGFIDEEELYPAVPENPRFQDFPHETVNEHMLIETGDDLCLNCHPGGVLP